MEKNGMQRFFAQQPKILAHVCINNRVTAEYFLLICNYDLFDFSFGFGYEFL
jgi:hypothetical protein